jgi:hypothetical protein
MAKRALAIAREKAAGLGIEVELAAADAFQTRFHEAGAPAWFATIQRI